MKKEKIFRKELSELLATEPRFDVVLSDGHSWVCPYCGKPSVNKKAKNFEDKVFIHLSQRCKKAKELEGDLIPEAHLKEIVEVDRLSKIYAVEPAWRIFMQDGVWLCPFCTETTGFKMKDANGQKRDTKEILKDISAHLFMCYKHQEDPTTWKSVDYIKNMLADKKRKAQEVAAIGNCVKTNPAYGFADLNGFWVCPFCESSIQSVDFSTPLARTNSAPYKILEHFKSGNCKFDGKSLDPNKTKAEMEAIVGRNAPEPEPEEANANDSGAYMAVLKGELDDLRSKLQVNDKMKTDLERARKAQQRMLPSAPPVLNDFGVEVYFQSCDEVSGDFYDFIQLPTGNIGIIMGDISGHGVDAGIVMGMAKKAFSLRAQTSPDIRSCVASVNSDLIPEMALSTFVTAIYGELDLNTYAFSYVRCGHTFPIHYSRATGSTTEIQSEGLMVGSVKEPKFSENMEVVSIPMERGDAIFLFTDGFPEAMTKQHEEFGIERMCDAIKRHGYDSAAGMTEGLVGATTIFAAGHPQEDDTTLIVIRRN